MANLKIRVFKGGEEKPETTVTIPAGVLTVASKLIPKQARAPLQEKGIDLDELLTRHIIVVIILMLCYSSQHGKS